MPDYLAILIAILLSLAAGAGIGWSLCQQRMRALCGHCQRALKMDEDEWEGAALVDGGTIPPPSLPLPSSAQTQELARLRELVPSPGLLRRAADALHYAAAGRGIDGNVAALLFRRLEELAARIEAAGAGAEPVPPAWEQTPTWRE